MHDDPQVPLVQADLSLEIQQLVPRSPVWIDPAAAVGTAARLMRDERVSSVLVRTEPPGIVTDRDLRNRVLAAGLGPDQPVSDVLSRPLHSVPAKTPLHEAWRILVDAGVHHLAVTRGDEIVGVVSATDFLRYTARGPLSVLWRVQRLASRESVRGYDARVAQMAATLLAGGLGASVIAGFVARLNDALVHRILAWAEADFGSPPAPYAFIVFGSEGRMEQTLLTDQDNALIYADFGAANGDWFRRLAERVNEDLEAAGFPPCAGGYMARNWHGPLSNWLERFAGWIDVPSRQAILVASIFFDFRKVGGELDLDPLEAAISGAARKTVFLRWLAKDALDFRPPSAFALWIRGDRSKLDLKRSAISPVVSLARCHALELGIRARGTIERLEAAARARGQEWGPVIEAYRFSLGLRLRHQLRFLADRKPARDEVALGDLTAVERTRLKEVLRAVRGWQEAARHHFHTEF